MGGLDGRAGGRFWNGASLFTPASPPAHDDLLVFAAGRLVGPLREGVVLPLGRGAADRLRVLELQHDLPALADGVDIGDMTVDGRRPGPAVEVGKHDGAALLEPPGRLVD